jgi:hypothetical protein
MKKSSKGIYQRRFFSANNAYLLYKSKQSSKKLDAVIDLRNCVSCTTVDRYGEFVMELMGVEEGGPGGSGGTGHPRAVPGLTFNYYLKARDMKEATAWVNNVKSRMGYYDKLGMAGQSEVAELWTEEERRSEREVGAEAEANEEGRTMTKDHANLLNATEDVARYSTNFSIKENAEEGEVVFEGWLMKKSPSKWVKFQER